MIVIEGEEKSCVCVCTKRVCVKFTVLVCKAVRLAFSCQTSAISFPFIPIPCSYTVECLLHSLSSLFNNLKSNNSENVPTQMDYFERRLCAQTQ